jgi:MFS superfamily sulfate permease-like transporter
MKKPSKAVVLTAFVLPGLGHYVLKRYISATILIGFSLALSYVLITTAIERALVISDKIIKGEIQPDLMEIARLASGSPSGDGANLVGYVTTALIAVWALALLDIYRVSRQ